MPMTQPLRRIAYAEKEVGRFKDDVQAEEREHGDWQKAHEKLRSSCWVCEDLIEKANHLFGRILDLDADIQEDIFAGNVEFDAQLDEKLDQLVKDWQNISLQLLPYAERLEREYGTAEGLDELRKNLAQAKSILTTDSEYFQGDALVNLRDEAIEAHGLGQTEPLFDNECVE